MKGSGDPGTLRLGLGRARLALALLFLIQLPAESRFPLVQLGPIGITNLEATGYALVAGWLASVSLGVLPGPRLDRVAAVALALLVAGAVAVSATAVYDPFGSLKVAARLVAAALVGAALVTELRADRARAVLLPFAAGAAVASAAIGIVETSEGWEFLGGFLALFREAPVTIGGVAVRATGTLVHPNLAGWYWGVAAIAILGVAAATGRVARAAAIPAALVLLVAAVLALSRGALIATEAAALLAALALPQVRRRPGWALVIVLALPVTLGFTAAGSSIVTARLVAETDQAWFDVRVEAPRDWTVDSTSASIPVTVDNRGPLVWRPGSTGPFVSYHLEDEEGRILDFDGPRTPLPSSLPAGGTVVVDARVDAPSRTGRYRVVWDLVQEGGGWFRDRSGSSDEDAAATAVHFRAANPEPPPAAPAPELTREEEDFLRSRSLTRGDLWTAARAFLLERPILGIGLDNFRLGYGEKLGLTRWDTDFNATNLYIESVVGAGVVFGGLFLALVAAALVRLLRPDARATLLGQVALLVLGAFLAHGFFDSFLTFSTGMYALFAALATALVRAPDA